MGVMHNIPPVPAGTAMKMNWKHAWKETDNEFMLWLLGAVAATGKSSSSILLGKSSRQQRNNNGFIQQAQVFCENLTSKIAAQFKTTDKKMLRTRQKFYVVSVAFRDTKRL